MVEETTPSEFAIRSSVRIECIRNDGQSSSGSGFIFSLLPGENNINVPALVTNRHVIKDAHQGLFFMNMAGSDGRLAKGKHEPVKICADFEAMWIPHPDPDVDLAILPIAPYINIFNALQKTASYWTITQEMVIDSRTSATLSAIENITMVGYPNGLWDEVNNVPLVRRGITATPLDLNYKGRAEFVIDAACFPGSSGSPIYLINEGSYSTGAGLTLGSRFFLLGILYAGPQITATGEITVVDVPTEARPIAVSHHMMNLGYCIKANRLFEFEAEMLKRGYIPPVGYKAKVAR